MKKKMHWNKITARRALCLVLSLTMAVGLAGCGKAEAEQASVINENNQENPKPSLPLKGYRRISNGVYLSSRELASSPRILTHAPASQHQ